MASTRTRAFLPRATLVVYATFYGFAGCATVNATAVDGNPGGTPGAAGGFSGRTTAGGNGGVSHGDGGSSSGGRGDTDGSAREAGDASADTGTGDAGPVGAYTLVVDTPSDHASVSGVVTVRGRAPGFLNVEIWDATHQRPPLAQTAPAADGTFSTTVDTTTLADGPTTWTVWAWDSLPGAPFDRYDSVPLYLTIGPPNADAGPPEAETIGTGDITSPAEGPAPTEAGKVGGAPFVLVKNWNFGTNGTISSVDSLVSEFQFHDQFGTIANGTKYGAVIVAPNAATAIAAPNLGLPGNMQPVEDPSRPNREWTADSLKAYVRPLTTTQTTCTVSAHDAGNGSLVAKWKLPNGGALLGKDLLWETRARMPVSRAAYWFALWTSGNQWNNGAEMDVVESFGTPNIYPPPTAFLSDTVGGQDSIDYSSWPNGLTAAGVPTASRDLSDWHVWTWVYKKDDTYKAYFDGYVVQTGTIHWTLGGVAAGQSLDLDFLFDFSWGHTQIADVNISLPASSFPITYEIDYSRVYLR